MRRIFYRLSLCLLAILLLSTCASAQSMHQEVASDSIRMDVTVGYQGLMTYGRSMPITVRMENTGSDLTGTLAVNIYNDKESYNRYEVEVSLAQNAVREIKIPVSVYSKQEVFTVELVQNGQVVCAVNAAPEQVVNPNAVLIGVLSDQPQQLSYMNIAMENDELFRSDYMQAIPLTKETFPDTPEELNAFGMLAVDRFDVSSLSALQQQTLRTWLETGHILLLGGGAQAHNVWPAFSDLTGLTAGQTAMHEDVTPALTAWLGVAADALGKEMLLCEAAGGEALILSGDTPVLWRSRVGSGCIYTAAFELGAKELVSWPLMHTFWQRLLLKDSSSLYQSLLNGGSYRYDSFAYRASRIPIENDANLLPVALTAAALLFALSAAAYALLKRVDKRQYLWAALPCISLVCACVVAVIAAGSSINEPLALSVSTLRQDAEGNRTDAHFVTVATAEKGEHLITSSAGSILPYTTQRYDYDDRAPIEPTRLNYRYLLGSQNGVGLNFTSPWDTQTFAVRDLPLSEGRIETSIWREEDGMHGVIINRTDYALKEGAVISRYGYCSIPALEPGQQWDFTFRSAVFADQKKPVYEDGCMYESLAGGYADIYTIADEYFFRTSQRKEGEVIEYTEEKNLLLGMMTLILNQDYERINGYYASPFHYITFSDDLPQAEVSMDGRVIDRRRSRGVVCAELKYESIGRTGVIYYTPGTAPAVRCQVDANGRPWVDPSAPVNTSYYHRVAENPVFAFDVSALGEADVRRMIIYSDSYLRSTRMLVYNGEDWVEQSLSREIADPAQYIQDGRVYVQFRSDATEEYMEVCTPAMLLEGRVK